MYNLTVGTDYLLVGELKESSGADYIQVGNRSVPCTTQTPVLN